MTAEKDADTLRFRIKAKKVQRQSPADVSSQSASGGSSLMA
ncbi:MAG: hypothetical protein ACQEW9_13600 [Bacteroidota bacterium]